jgi:integrase
MCASSRAGRGAFGVSGPRFVRYRAERDLRRTCAKLCRKNGGDLEQIKFLLGHSSIQTTERYLGSEQDIELYDGIRLLVLSARQTVARGR